MKIGILTFHSQLNYGGVLQCWALQSVLQKMGHDVAIIDRWLDVDNSFLECGYNKLDVKGWLKFCVRTLLGLGDINELIRVIRTKKFIKKYLYLTPYHFVDWEHAPENLGIDVLIVGSDQVWHCGDSSNPAVYLLEGAPCIPAVAYAASFGMPHLPEFSYDGKMSGMRDSIYKRGLKKFRSISCREREGVMLCRELGFSATHVLDPTLLMRATEWIDGLGLTGSSAQKHKKVLVCYLLSENLMEMLPYLHLFARRERCVIKVFLNTTLLLPFPSSRERLKRYVTGIKTRFSP